MLEQLNPTVQEVSYRHLFETMPQGVLYLEVQAASRDVTERREAEEGLRKLSVAVAEVRQRREADVSRTLGDTVQWA